jgi:hypothetical protein
MVRNRKHRASRPCIRLEYGRPHHGERGSPPGYEKLFTFRKLQYPDWVFSGTFDELPNITVGLGPLNDLEAAGARASNEPTQSSNFPDDHHYTNTVST